MNRLGYTRYVAQGGDVGAFELMAVLEVGSRFQAGMRAGELGLAH